MHLIRQVVKLIKVPKGFKYMHLSLSETKEELGKDKHRKYIYTYKIYSIITKI